MPLGFAVGGFPPKLFLREVSAVEATPSSWHCHFLWQAQCFVHVGVAGAGGHFPGVHSFGGDLTGRSAV